MEREENGQTIRIVNCSLRDQTFVCTFLDTFAPALLRQEYVGY